MENMIYHWKINEIDIKILLPDYGMVNGNFNRAEKQHEFLEIVEKFPGGIIKRIGVSYPN